MKRILLFALLILGMSLELGAQAKIYTKKMKVADFTDKTLKVVLSGGEMADAPFKARVLDHWRISPYEFCTLSEFERDKADTNLYFMFIAGKNDGLDHLEVVKGSKVPGENLEKMLSVVSLPLRATGEKGTRYLSYLGAYLDIFQEFILEAMHNDIVGYSGLSNKAFRARAEKGSVFLVADCDVAEMPDEAMTAALAERGMRIVSEAETTEKMDVAAAATLVSYCIRPIEPVKHKYCYSLLVGAEDHKLYYCNKKYYVNENNAGFNRAAFKRFVRLISPLK
ncbi:MAG: hypothetical protein J6Y32_08060 [Bacteroidales bacterium]|nr:hypothetical protein [Bacteroidales bacterium]